MLVFIVLWHTLCNCNIGASYVGIYLAYCNPYASIRGIYIASAYCMPRHDGIDLAYCIHHASIYGMCLAYAYAVPTLYHSYSTPYHALLALILHTIQARGGVDSMAGGKKPLSIPESLFKSEKRARKITF